MKNAKKLLALALSILMVATMFSIVPMSVLAEDGVAAGDSATASRLDDWKGNITTTLAIGSSGSHADVDEATGYHLYPDVAELYVGDSIKTDGNWLNYALNYTNESGEAVSGTLNDNADWYCDGAWKFNSQLKNGKINSWTDNTPKALDQAGTWTCTVKMSTGDTITLTSFEVNELPRFFGGDTFKGNIDVSVKPGEPLDFSTTDIFVGDKLVNGGGGKYWKNDWSNVPFTVDGVAYTGGITNFKIVTPSGNTGFEKNMWMGGSIDYVLPEAGTYTVYTTMESVKDADGISTDNKYNVNLCTFEVQGLPRMYKNLDGEAVFTGNENISVTPLNVDALKFSRTTDIYVGDKIVKGYTGNWTDAACQGIKFVKDGATYTGAVTWFKVVGPSGNVSSYGVWSWSNAIDYVFSKPGEYTIRAKFEKVKDASGNSASDVDNVDITTLTVKDLPRATLAPDGSTNYTGPQNVTVQPTTTLEFSTTDLYVGDKIVKGYTGNWTDKKTVEFTVNDTQYKGALTWLRITSPSGTTWSYGVWNWSNAIDLVLPEAGTYTMSAKFEYVTDSTGASASNFDNVAIGTFEVKECPHNFELTETVAANCAAGGYELYTCSYCGATEKRNETEISGEHNFVFTETVAPTCTAKGYDIYTCDGCNTTEQRNETEMAAHDFAEVEFIEGDCTSATYTQRTCAVCDLTEKVDVVVAPGHELSINGDTVSCANCDYANTYTGESVDVTYDIKDLTGLNGYTNATNISAFVGDTLTNASNWWSNHTFTYGELSGKVYNIWVVKGDLDYFNEYREARLADNSYSDENVTYIQIGYGNTVSAKLDTAGTYTIVAALECYENSAFLTNIEPIVIGTVEVFDVPTEDAPVEGDIDGDKEVTAADLITLQQHVLGIATIEDTTVADINKDGVIDAVDLVLVQFKILGL